ncbi:LLM class flavin-dependent oxidoreductase [Sphaerimonospora mesophila]|uniref:LLM class flavin-dependent oxidoreductase n=1 Tax=Sphaerimonospora mesophila TaxID=37483 RepID=UPI001F2EEB1E
MVPFVAQRPEQVLQYAAMVQWTNAERLWQGQSMLVESHQQGAFAAGMGFRVPIGIGVSLMPLSHPYQAAVQARSLAMSTGHPVIAGFGPGPTVFQRSMLGRPYRSQLTAVREYVQIVRGLLDGDTVDVSGEYFCFQGGLYDFPAPRVDVGLGVLRPGMARLAGEVADVAITWLTPASYLRDVIVPALREGAAAAGRPVPKVTAMVPLALRRADREAGEIALAGNAMHLKFPHYTDMLRRAGILIEGVDPAADARALVEGGAFLSGDLDGLVKRLRAYADADVDEIVLNVTGVLNLFGPQAALNEVKTILKAVA